MYDYTSGGVTYRVHVFNSSGTFNVYEDLAALGDIRYLVVGGGGGGHQAIGGGAGGAGGVLTGILYSLTIDDYGVTVGAGGSGGTTGRANGLNSVFHTFMALGGGYGGGGIGGSGGGGTAAGTAPGDGEAGPPLQGYEGGLGFGTTGTGRSGGGGGGYSSAGGPGNVDRGTGGTGFNAASILGLSEAYWIAGGGGGSGGGTSVSPTPPGSGTHGGGDGGYYSIDLAAGVPGEDGLANTGGGGGAGGFWHDGTYRTVAAGSGGSGLVVISYVIPEPGSVLLLVSGALVLAAVRRRFAR